MTAPIDTVTVTLPRSLASDIPTLADDLTDRMHELLERNTDGALSPAERVELQTLVQMAQFAQILALAVQQAPKP
ncbi:MAG TPA: hypothetical protein VGM03_23100 [Phycisphaerae bacterium]